MILAFLDELLKAVELEYEIEHVDELSEPEKNAIDEGISDAEAGNLHSNAEASQLVKKWLKKQGGQPALLLTEQISTSIGSIETNRTSTLKNSSNCSENPQNSFPTFRT